MLIKRFNKIIKFLNYKEPFSLQYTFLVNLALRQRRFERKLAPDSTESVDEKNVVKVCAVVMIFFYDHNASSKSSLFYLQVFLVMINVFNWLINKYGSPKIVLVIWWEIKLTVSIYQIFDFSNKNGILGLIHLSISRSWFLRGNFNRYVIILLPVDELKPEAEIPAE